MVTSFLKIYLIFIKKGQFLKGRKERPQRDINSPWSLRIGIFRKIHFIVCLEINNPEKCYSLK